MLHDDIAALTDICPQEDIQAATKPTPVRSLLTDDTEEIFGFAIRELAKGRVALATLVEIRGERRALGSHVAIAADGRFVVMCLGAASRQRSLPRRSTQWARTEIGR